MSATPVSPQTSSQPKSRALDALIQRYGDLIFDIASSLSESTPHAQTLFRSILRDLEHAAKSHTKNTWGELERAWVLSVAYRRVCQTVPEFTPHLANNEQLHLDASDGVAQKMKRLIDFFKLLPRDEKWLLLLHEKHQIPMSEISSAMGLPVATLQFIRKSALAELEEKVWGI